MKNMKKLLVLINIWGFSIFTCNNIVSCSCSATNKTDNYLQQSFNNNNQLNFSATSVESFGLTVKDASSETYNFDWQVVSNQILQQAILPINNTVPVQLVAKVDDNNYPTITVGTNGQKVAAVSLKDSTNIYNANNNIITIKLLLTLFQSDGNKWINQNQTMDIVVNVVTQDISQAISLNDLAINPLTLEANINDNYQSLNSNETIIQAIIDAFHQIKTILQPQVNVDFIVTNNQNPNDHQESNKTIEFTVRAVSTSIIISPDSQTTFMLNLIAVTSIIDLADININSINLETNKQETYNDLNSNPILNKTIIDAIVSYQETANPQINIDFTITNNQNPNDFQSPNPNIIISVIATNNSKILKPNSQTTFTISLTAPSETVNLNNITVTDPIITANPAKDYEKLNSNQYIIQAVIDGVNNYRSETNPKIGDDFTITNDQITSDKQNHDVVVTFSVSAVSSSKLLTANSQKSFTITLIDSVNLNHVKVVGIPYVAANVSQTYQQLNSNHTVIDAIIQAIKETKAGVTPVENVDFIISNDQDPEALQTSKTKVKFTVIANESSKILMANTQFSFILDLG